MAIKCSAFVAISLDGYIARRNGNIDWLDNYNDSSETEDYGFKEFYKTVDTLVIGRKTYELVLTFKEWPYPDRKVIVLSNGSPVVPNEVLRNVEVLAGPPSELVKHLAAKGSQHLYIDGGKTIQSFLKAGAIQELTISHIPILIGDGIPLFGKLEQDQKLTHLETRTFPNGIVQSRYHIG
jgi:dihydrofolate reductase